ncbi:MAG: 1-pyrroline-5-carboxylate dehydrogenase 1 [Calditrichaeota bacterium]|nr:1-pyrroline-5-carboxylate dehydrogenase 1 [Calditrichota bacterium]
MSIVPFENEPLTDFSVPENKQAFAAALEKVRGDFGEHWDLLIGGEGISSDRMIESFDPAKPDRIVGTVAKASKQQAKQAVETAYDFWNREWRWTDGNARARILLRAAKIMRERKHELSATMVYEESKAWLQADADTAEAIDFLEFYAREMMRLEGAQEVVAVPAEENTLYYIPLGVVVVIPPWNFPCAIMAGMTSAALVTGNCAVLKPASTAPVIAAKFVDILLEAGMPAEAITFCPGSGGEVGDTLVDHPKTRMVAFTGSKEIGLRINERAAKVHEDQIWIKRVILEMGGKDAMVVDESADLDNAAEMAIKGAFQFQGQKCSACSRLIAVDNIYDQLVDKVAERAKKLKVAHAETDPDVAAVIDADAQEKILQYIEFGKQDGGELICGGNAIEGGYFVEPTVFRNVKPDHRIAQEEIFGPVLACIRARDFDDAVEIFNGTEYGLTGGLLSSRRDRIERARRQFHVGNLYFNRKITAALVGVQPFGGFNMSGTDSKAGGQDYLQLFMQAKSVTEKL